MKPMSANNRSAYPIPVLGDPETQSSKHKRSVDNHSYEQPPVDQYGFPIPSDAAFSSAWSSSLVVPDILAQPSSQASLPAAANTISYKEVSALTTIDENPTATSISDHVTILRALPASPNHSYVQASSQPNMNDPFVLDLYTKLVKFQLDTARTQAIYDHPNHATQDLLHSLARKLSLEFEYSLSLQRVCLSRATIPSEDVEQPSQQHEQVPETSTANFSADDLRIQVPDLSLPFEFDEFDMLMPSIFTDELPFTEYSDASFPFPFANGDAFSASYNAHPGSNYEASLDMSNHQHHGISTLTGPNVPIETSASTARPVEEAPLPGTHQLDTPQHDQSIELDSVDSHISSGCKAGVLIQEHSLQFTFVPTDDAIDRCRAVAIDAAKAVKAAGGAAIPIPRVVSVLEEMRARIGKELGVDGAPSITNFRLGIHVLRADPRRVSMQSCPPTVARIASHYGASFV
ncbi:uncharacterized protein PAC_15589 [Phialocephala subalpina]|uniref:Uncharacterized protein n=1 Tax=Phialocephala subalpina TaxID=576137 RepID=A0A1L7XKX0_9HELO|nr:uncharacterized protein PAC_15589 [Phialocephala subalpina]